MMTDGVRGLGRRCLPVLLATGLTLVGCGGDGDGEAAPTRAGSGSSATLARGVEIYKLQCAMCHGDTGKGDGIGANALAVKPRDLTAEPYKFVDVAGSASEVEALEKYIATGRIESGMPAFGGMLTPSDLHAVATYVQSIRPANPGG